MKNPPAPLRLNVGFIARQPIGYRRDFHVDFPNLHLPPDLDLRNFSGRFQVSRNTQGLLVEAEVSASTEVDCVRCLTRIDQPLKAEFADLYAFSKRNMTESELLFPEDGHIDLGPLVREYLILEIPISSLCQTDCKGLCPICGENRNENPCTHDVEDIDPRLSSLQSFLND